MAAIGRLSGTGDADDFDRAARIASNLASENGGLVAARAIEADLLEEVLGGLHFADVVDDLDGIDVLIGSVGRSGLTELSERAFARLVFDSPDAALMVRNASLDVVLTDRALAADVAALAAGQPAEIAEVFLLQQNLDRVVANRAGVTEVLDALEHEAVEFAQRNVELAAQSNALDRLNDAEVAAGAGAHGSSRHNAGTRLIDHYRRIGTGQLPDGGFDDTIQTQSGRAISHDDYAAAVKEAIAVNATRASTGLPLRRFVYVRFTDERPVGQVIARGGSGVESADTFWIDFGQANRWRTTTFRKGLPADAKGTDAEVVLP